MNKLENWTEVTKGLYRYVIAANVAYEIHIMYWDRKTDILSAHCELYIVGDWRTNDSGSYFERGMLCDGPLAACLECAVEDDKENNK